MPWRARHVSMAILLMSTCSKHFVIGITGNASVAVSSSKIQNSTTHVAHAKGARTRVTEKLYVAYVIEPILKSPAVRCGGAGGDEIQKNRKQAGGKKIEKQKKQGEKKIGFFFLENYRKKCIFLDIHLTPIYVRGRYARPLRAGRRGDVTRRRDATVTYIFWVSNIVPPGPRPHKKHSTLCGPRFFFDISCAILLQYMMCHLDSTKNWVFYSRIPSRSL